MPKIFKHLIASFCLTVFAAQAMGETDTRTIRFAMTPAFLHDQHALLAQWRVYLEDRLKRPVKFVQRDSYRDTMDLLLQQKVDFAWICDYPYVALKDNVRLLAVAINQTKPTYRSYLIVPVHDTTNRSFDNLRGSVFAFADPYSNTGYLVPRFMIKRSGADPATFFKKTFFTWSHRKAIDAVAVGLAQGAMVDSFVWDSLARVRPDITAKTRIAWQSEEYGFPPIVAQRDVATADFNKMQRVLLDMNHDSEGRALMTRLNLNGFVAGKTEYYDGVADMMKLFGEP